MLYLLELVSKIEGAIVSELSFSIQKEDFYY